MRSTINITGANVPYNYSREYGVITLNALSGDYIWSNYTALSIYKKAINYM